MNEELKVIISAEITKLKQNVNDAKQQISNFKEQVDKASKNVKENFAKIGEGIKNGIKTAATSIAAAGAALIALGASTQEYRNEQAKLVSAFEAAGSSAAVAKDTYNDLYRVLGDSGQATEAANHLAKLTTSQQGLSEWTTICQGVYATFGDSLPIEGLTEAANETAKTGALTGSLADALNWAGVNEDDFQAKLEKCNTEAKREQLIRETLNGLYTDAANKYEANNKQVLAQNEAQAKLQDTMAKLGEAVAPVVTAFTNFANQALAVVTPYIQELSNKYMPALEEVLGKVSEALGTAFNFVVQHKEMLAVIGGVIATVVAAIGLYNAVAAVKAAMDAAQVATLGALVTAYAAQAAAMVAAIAPYVAIVAAIAAVIAIIVVCIKHWDDIKAAAVKAWEGIKSVWAKAGEWFKGIVDAIKKAFDGIGEWFKNLFAKAWEGIKSAWSGVTNWFSDIWNGIKNVFNVVANWFKSIFTNAWNGIKSAWSGVKTWFSDLWNGIKSVYSAVSGWFSSIFTTAYNGIRNAFSGITGFFSGIWNDIKNIFSNVGTAIASGIRGAVSGAINAVLSTAANIINGFINSINFAIRIINRIPGVNIRRIRELNIPAMAQGGVVDSATLAMIGENGKEAVVPLENNLEWLNKLAGMLNERMGGNTPIVLQVDGKTFAQISCDSINQLTRQRGSIPLVIA